MSCCCLFDALCVIYICTKINGSTKGNKYSTAALLKTLQTGNSWVLLLTFSTLLFSPVSKYTLTVIISQSWQINHFSSFRSTLPSLSVFPGVVPTPCCSSLALAEKRTHSAGLPAAMRIAQPPSHSNNASSAPFLSALKLWSCSAVHCPTDNIIECNYTPKSITS